jgi:hypothetical protein
MSGTVQHADDFCGIVAPTIEQETGAERERPQVRQEFGTCPAHARGIGKSCCQILETGDERGRGCRILGGDIVVDHLEVGFRRGREDDLGHGLPGESLAACMEPRKNLFGRPAFAAIELVDIELQVGAQRRKPGLALAILADQRANIVAQASILASLHGLLDMPFEGVRERDVNRAVRHVAAPVISPMVTIPDI